MLLNFFVLCLRICISVAMVIFAVLDFPILIFLPQLYTEPFGKSTIIICALFVISLFYAWTLSATSDLVPSLVYFHLAVALENTNKFFVLKKRHIRANVVVHQESVEILPIVEDDNNDIPQDWQKGWLYYEAIRKLVHKTDSLFGSILLVNHGTMFFVASANIFSVL